MSESRNTKTLKEIWPDTESDEENVPVNRNIKDMLESDSDEELILISKKPIQKQKLSTPSPIISENGEENVLVRRNIKDVLDSDSDEEIILKSKKQKSTSPIMSENETEEITSVNDAIFEYYKLKEKFENEIEINKKTIINNQNLSNKEKRIEFLKIKPKCVNCRRPSKKGTIFSVTYRPSTDEISEHRVYKAICGDLLDPCSLNIEINIGIRNRLDEELNNLNNEITDAKNKIINDKNKLLFGLITTETALENFDNNKSYINDLTSIYEKYLDIWNKEVDNQEKKLELDEALVQSYEIINTIKDCIKKMNENDDIQFAVEAASIYNTTLQPLLNKIRHLKYNENMVFYDDNTCRLIQRKYLLEDILITGYTSKIIAYDVGLKAMIPKKKKKDLFSIDSDESKGLSIKIQEPTQTKSIEELVDEPIIGQGVDGIDWHTEEYKYLWGKLPVELKNEFKLNIDWMKEFMHKCVNAKENYKKIINEREKFRNEPIPSNLIIPPKKLANGEYDFGISIYNNAFNKLPKLAQEKYLTFKVPLLSHELKRLVEESSFRTQWTGCRLTTPPNLIIPPRQMENGQYDFGVSIYNKVFSKLPKSLQSSYLTYYKEDPTTKEKNYNMLIDTINSLVEKEVNFSRGFF